MKLSEALQQAAALEREVAATLRLAAQLAARGLLDEKLCVVGEQLQWATYWVQKLLLGVLRETVLSVPGGSVVAKRIPKPPRPAPLCSRGVRVGLQGGLGTPVVALVVAGAVAATAAVAAAWAVAQGIEVAGTTATTIAQLREYTKQYRAALEERARRYNQCLRDGGDAQSCAQSAPVPVPEPPPAVADAAAKGRSRPLLWALAGVGALVALGLAGYWVLRWRERGRGVEGLEGGDVEALPAGSHQGLGRYMLEVEADG